jgi:hypothetical protein
MNDLHTTVTLVDGYDKRKTPRQLHFRHFTLEDINRLRYGREYWFISNQGTARKCRVSSALKTWKKDPNRLECSFKYGMYESVRWSKDEMLQRLLMEV